MQPILNQPAISSPSASLPLTALSAVKPDTPISKKPLRPQHIIVMAALRSPQQMTSVGSTTNYAIMFSTPPTDLK